MNELLPRQQLSAMIEAAHSHHETILNRVATRGLQLRQFDVVTGQSVDITRELASSYERRLNDFATYRDMIARAPRQG